MTYDDMCALWESSILIIVLQSKNVFWVLLLYHIISKNAIPYNDFFVKI